MLETKTVKKRMKRDGIEKKETTQILVVPVII